MRERLPRRWWFIPISVWAFAAALCVVNLYGCLPFRVHFVDCERGVVQFRKVQPLSYVSLARDRGWRDADGRHWPSLKRAAEARYREECEP